VTNIEVRRLGKGGISKIVVDAPGGRFAIKADLLDEEGHAKALDRILKKCPGLDREKLEQALDEECSRPEPSNDTLAERLLDYLRQPGKLDLFHGPDHDAFAFVPVGEHEEGKPTRKETMRVAGSMFKLWVSRQAYLALGKVPSAETIKSVLNAIAGDALFQSPERVAFVRIGHFYGTSPEVWIDLANDERTLVRVTPAGWSIVPASKAPIRFVRMRGQYPLPTPERGGAIGELRNFLNLDDRQWVLVRGFAVMAFRPHGPYPILLVNGEQGSAKSSLGRALRLLVDPNQVDNRRPPKDPQSLAISAKNGWLLSMDNMSGIQQWLSDDLCSLVTGAGFATRELYADGEEVLFGGARPLILNGIDDLGTRADLADRGIALVLRAIPDKERREESDLWAEFEDARPRMLGAFLDAVVVALAREPHTHLDSPPRMADFARWVEAAAPSLGLAPGEFLSAYRENRAGSSALALESSPFALAVRDLVERVREWSGSASELLSTLAPPAGMPTDRWPQTAKKVADLLRRYAPCFRAAGIDFEHDERDPKSRRTVYSLRVLPAQGSEPSTPVVQLAPEEPAEDAKDCAAPIQVDLYAAEERAAMQDDNG
jgi:hypothetical protein